MDTKNVYWILSNSGQQAGFQPEGDLRADVKCKPLSPSLQQK